MVLIVKKSGIHCLGSGGFGLNNENGKGKQLLLYKAATPK
jgi:hypothetical protein